MAKSIQNHAVAKRATIYDVATRANVSIATVSLALAGHARIPDETKVKVRAAAQELQYIPSGPARALACRKTGVIGLVVSDNANPFFAQIVRGAEGCARPHGRSLLLTNSDEDPEREMECVALLFSKGVDGIVFAPSMTSADPIEWLRDKGVPFVLVNRHMDDAKCDYVVSDNLTAGRLATRHLLCHGHRRVAHIMGPAHRSCARERLAGYQLELRDAGINDDRELVFERDWQGNGFAEVMDQLMGMVDPPTAVFAYNDLLALKCISYLKERGLDVPHDVAVVGHDDLYFASFCNPALTTVAQNAFELGRRAVEILLMREKGALEESPVHIVLEPRLVVRESCGSRNARTQAVSEAGSTVGVIRHVVR
jgi:LacI family transcriptional regulator